MGNNISQELINKIQEKLGSALDIITFENGQKIYDYLAKYLQVRNLTIFIIMTIIVFICILMTIYFKNNDEDYSIPLFLASIVFFAIWCVCLYDLVISYMFPAISIIDWLK